MSNWSDWLDWGGRPAPVRSLNNLYGPTSMGTPYQWLRPPGAPFPTPSGAQFPMFSPAGSPNYPMFGPNAGVPNVSVGAGPMPAMSWAERVATAGYSPATSTSQLVPMFDAAGNPSSIPRPMFDAAGNSTPITQTYSPGPGVPARPQVPGGATQFKTPLVPNQPSLMPNASPMNLANPTRVPMFDAAGNLNPIPGGGTPYTPGPGVPTNPYTQAGASTAAKYPMFDAAGNPAPGPVNGPRPPSLMPNARPMNGTGQPSAPSAAPTTTRVTPGTTPPGHITPGPQPAAPTGGPQPPAPTSVPQPKLGPGAQNPYLNAAQKGANAGQVPPAGPGARAGAAAGGAQPTGSAPTNPYSAFWGRNPLNVRGALSPTGSVGSKLPGFLTQYRGFGPSPTGAVGSRLPNFLTQPLGTPNPGVTGWRARLSGPGANMAAGLGAQVALHAVGSGVPMAYENLTGRPVSQQGYETSRSTTGLAATALPFFGAPVAAAVGAGAALGDVVGSAEGAGVANFLRENVLSHAPEWMPGDMQDWGPTNDGIGDILGRIPWGIGSILGGTSEGEQQQAQDPIAALPPTPESIATVGQMAGLDPSSIGFLQQQFDGSMALARATYAADPEGSKKQFESLYGRPMESEDDLAQVLFSKIVQESLPAALENQSAQAAALQNAAMYQDFISKYMAPIRDQYNDLGAQAAAAGYGDLALQFQGQGASQEAAMRAIPSLEALRAQQAQVNQLAQSQYQSMMSGAGSTGADPLGDAATLDALMAAAG